MTASDLVSDTVAAIVARLAARHDGLTILGAVTEACGTLLGADATGVLVVDPRGGVEVLAASEERALLVELLQVQAEEGPCLQCLAANAMIASVDLAGDRDRWPTFAPAAAEAGFRSIYAFPLRLMGSAVGGLNLLYTEPVELSAVQSRLAQALADLATLGLTQERDLRRVERLAEQTLTTLNDRVHVGHAVGMVAGVLGIHPQVARAKVLDFSATGGRSLRDIARHHRWCRHAAQPDRPTDDRRARRIHLTAHPQVASGSAEPFAAASTTAIIRRASASCPASPCSAWRSSRACCCSHSRHVRRIPTPSLSVVRSRSRSTRSRADRSRHCSEPLVKGIASSPPSISGALARRAG